MNFTCRIVLLRILILAVMFTSLPCLAADDPVARKVEDYLAAWHDSGRFAGSALVAVGERVVVARGFGEANRELHVANSPETRFRIGSMTKQFVTALVLQLVGEGKLRLDGTISEYLPQYRKDTGSKVTIDHLLRHTSGIPSYTSHPDFWKRLIRKHYGKEEMLRELHSGDLESSPGAAYRYNNTGFFLLGLIVEEVTGTSLAEALDERILKPLGLEDTGVDRRLDMVEGRADGYLEVADGWVNEPYVYMPNLSGAGDMYSTVEDILRWNRALFLGSVVPREYRHLLTSAYQESEQGIGHAYGNQIHAVPFGRDGAPVTFYSFNGSLFGFHCDAFRFPEEDLVVVLFSNVGEVDLWSMAAGVYRLVEGLGVRAPLPSVVGVVTRQAVAEGAEAAKATFEELRRAEPQAHDFRVPEYEVNRLGYRLMDLGRVEQAVAVFELNVLFHPDSFNAHDSLGEAYMRCGSWKESIASYTRSLDLNPNNGNAVAMLERIAEVSGIEVQLETNQDLPGAGEILETFRNHGYEAAVALVVRARKAAPEMVIFQGPRIGPRFEELLAAGDTDNALALCRLWVLGSPRAVGPYFSMARVYRRLQDAEAEAACYQTIIEMDPQAPAAATARRRLGELGPGAAN